MPSNATGAELLERLTLRAANDGEALISTTRTVFCLVVLGRFLALPDVPTSVGAKLGLEAVLLVAGAIASALAVRRARRGKFRTPGLVAWSMADAGICFGSLLSNVLWPDERYVGLLRMPDIAVLLPVIFVSALRLTPVATLASMGANLVALAALVAIDRYLNGSRLLYDSNEVTMVLLLVITVGLATWMTSFGARRLVWRAGHESVQLERARQRLDTLLREHHDVRTLLSTARINLQLACGHPSAASKHLAIVERAIIELGDFIESVKGRAFAELAILDGPTAVAVDRAVEQACVVARHRFPRTRIEAAVPSAQAQIVGGERALLQVVFNLLANACEGTGARQASHVRVEASISDPWVTLRVEDDGTGFLDEVLDAGTAALPSTKPGGSGLGLMLVREIVTASGGSLDLRNRKEGGASVTLQLVASLRGRD